MEQQQYKICRSGKYRKGEDKKGRKGKTGKNYSLGNRRKREEKNGYTAHQIKTSPLETNFVKYGFQWGYSYNSIYYALQESY